MVDRPIKLGDLLGITDLEGQKNLNQLLGEIQAVIRQYLQNTAETAGLSGDLRPEPEMRIIFCCLLEALAWSREVEMPFPLLQDLFLALGQNTTDVH